MHTKGVIIGKFMPPHKGHEYLVQFASSFVDELWVFVCTLPDEIIPGELRFQWMKDLFPQVKLVHIQEVNPQANRYQKNAHTIWARAVKEHVGSSIQYVFASESYGWNFAQALEAEFVPVDPSRDQFPISGTEVRTRPFRYWHFIPERIKPWFVKEIALQINKVSDSVADEIILAAARLLETLYVPVYEDFYRNFFTNQTDLPPSQTSFAARAQKSLEASLRKQANRFLLIPARSLKKEDAVDLHITIDAVSATEKTAEKQNPTKPRKSPLQLKATLETMPYIIRDCILDYYQDLL